MTKARDIASAAPAPSTVSATELGYLDGVSSAIQTQLDAKTAKSTLTTTGDIYYASSANTPARLGIGSTDQVLKVSGGVPVWATAAGGGLDLISTTSFSAVSSVSVSSCFSATYDNYLIKLNSTTVASSNSSVSLRLRVSGTDTTTNYRTQYIAGNGTGLSAGRGISETSFAGIGYVQPAFNNEFTLNITNPYNTVITTGFTNQVQAGGGNIESYIAAFGLNDTTSYTGFTIISPNNLTGSVSVYGYKK